MPNCATITHLRWYNNHEFALAGQTLYPNKPSSMLHNILKRKDTKIVARGIFDRAILTNLYAKEYIQEKIRLLLYTLFCRKRFSPLICIFQVESKLFYHNSRERYIDKSTTLKPICLIWPTYQQCIVQYYIMAGHAIVVVKDITLLFYHGNAVILTLW